MSDPVLSPDDIRSFEERGYVRLPEAFPRDSALTMQDFMWDQLKQLCGIDRHDRSTWTNRWHGLNKTGRHGIYKGVGSPRMLGAIDQLLGAGTWTKAEGWGGFLVTFPQGNDQPWDVTTEQWHWDGGPAQHVGGLSGLFIFTLYSHVAPQGGGTLIVEGSHRLIMSFFRGLDPNRLSGKQKGLKRHFYRSHPWLAELTGQAPDSRDRVRPLMEETTVIDDVPVRVVELTGEPGDAVLCHPSIFHARSFNRAEVPRFMRAGGVSKRERGPKPDTAQPR